MATKDYVRTSTATNEELAAILDEVDRRNQEFELSQLDWYACLTLNGDILEVIDRSNGTDYLYPALRASTVAQIRESIATGLQPGCAI